MAYKKPVTDTPTTQTQTIFQNPNGTTIPPTTNPKGVKGRVVQLYAGVDLAGSKMSLNSRESDIDIYDWGVRVTSKKNKRVIRIYASNIKGVEELTTTDVLN